MREGWKIVFVLANGESIQNDGKYIFTSVSKKALIAVSSPPVIHANMNISHCWRSESDRLILAHFDTKVTKNLFRK